MSADSASINLTHHFLIAMPGLEDASFAKSVVYLCEHSERGALGLVINKPSDLSMRGLFEKVELPLRREDLFAAPVLQGGPVHTERGFVLHDPIVVPRADTEAEALAADCWPLPELALNINTTEMGNLGLTSEEFFHGPVELVLEGHIACGTLAASATVATVTTVTPY